MKRKNADQAQCHTGGSQTIVRRTRMGRILPRTGVACVAISCSSCIGVHQLAQQCLSANSLININGMAWPGLQSRAAAALG